METMSPVFDTYLQKLIGSDDRPITKLLPLIFNLKGKPYSLDWSHYMMEPMFKLRGMPRRMLYKTGRQISKSSSMAASQIIRAAAIPYYNILTVMPLYEQVRKLSQNYVRPFIVESRVRDFLTGENGTDAVLQRSIGNRGSTLFYSYTGGSGADRIRGISCSEIDIDEVQDMDMDTLPIIEATMSASPWKISRFTGTPKTMENTIEQLWRQSSQAIWHIPCQTTGCKRENRCCAQDGDLLDMMGEKTLVCCKCGQPLNSRLGYYVHAKPERRISFPGYHVSQPALPMHYEQPKDWFGIKTAQKEKMPYIFYNEFLGESYDNGAKLLTSNELRAAMTATAMTPDTFDVDQYYMTMTGADWGGRGKVKATDTNDFISNTAIACGGLNNDGTIDINWLYKVPYSMSHDAESDLVARVAGRTHSHMIAMDYGGQGNVQELLLAATGWPKEKIIPFTYNNSMAAKRPIIFYQPPKHFGVRNSYTLDKTRSILLLIQLIKTGMVRLPNDEKYFQDHLQDFLHITEETTDTPRGAPRRLITRSSGQTDDIVHAINYVVMGLYHCSGQWPAVAKAFMDTETEGSEDDA